MIICTYNNVDRVSKCLRSVFRQTYKHFDCIVVDDNSTDGTAQNVSEHFPEVRVCEKPVNTGPAQSRNIGASISDSDYLVFLDSDIELEKDWIKKQVAILDKDDYIAVSGGKLLYKDHPDKINSAGGWMSRLGFASDDGRDLNKNECSIPHYVPYLCSAACIVRNSDFKFINGFDDSYFYPHEDADFCWRIWITGKQVYYDPNTIAYHDVGATTNNMKHKAAYHATKNRILTIMKNYRWYNVLLYLPIHMAIVCFAIVKPPTLARISGIIWPFWNIDKVINKRRIIQNLRKTKDRDIIRMFSWRIR